MNIGTIAEKLYIDYCDTISRIADKSNELMSDKPLEKVYDKIGETVLPYVGAGLAIAGILYEELKYEGKET